MRKLDFEVTERMTEFTSLLASAQEAGKNISAEILPVVYEELRKLARGQMVRERASHTLQPTALVHEAYLRLMGQQDAEWANRAHFFGAAAQAMRRILVDHARGKATAKRGGSKKRVELDQVEFSASDEPEDLLALDEALHEFQQLDERKHQVVMLRYFAGLTVDETAQALSISRTTVKEDWGFARAWLLARMCSDDS